MSRSSTNYEDSKDAEIARLRAELANETRLWALDLERRVSAEVAVTRLTAELAEEARQYDALADVANYTAERCLEARSAVTRVRELCSDHRYVFAVGGFAPNALVVGVRAVLRALDGAE